MTRCSAASASRSSAAAAETCGRAPSSPAFARCTNDWTTGACATSLPSAAPGRCCIESKYSRHSCATEPGLARYCSYRSSMNGALPPNRYEFARNSFIMIPLLAARLAPCDRRHLAAGGAAVQLARAPDLVLGIGDHLLPLRDPPDRAREREDAGEHRHRDAERALHDSRVEVDVRVELALDEIGILERDLLQRERQLEEATVVQSELAQHLVASLAHELRTRIVILVHAVAESHQPHPPRLVLHLAD